MSPIQISKKLLSWASIAEDSAIGQALMTSEMPMIMPHMALMPDTHLGKGCCVGSVVPTYKAIIPSVIGVDLSCGMIAINTHIQRDQIPSDLSPLRLDIERRIPLSAGSYNTELTETAEIFTDKLEDLTYAIPDFDPSKYAPNWKFQLGSLGSGNHFIEMCIDENNDLWLFLHSGSRGIGNKIATHFIKRAQELCEKRYIDLPHKDLAYFVEGDREYSDYIAQTTWAGKFAEYNVREMMNRLSDAFCEFTGFDTSTFDKPIYCCHNYSHMEHHFGKDLWVNRKGAIDASEGTWGLIPGSMGTASYVVVGKGNKAAFNTAPHGAGRNYGRAAAKKKFSYSELVESMKGIEWSGSMEFIDEIPDAYKDIDIVMEDAKDLVEIKYTLKQVLNVKGD